MTLRGRGLVPWLYLLPALASLVVWFYEPLAHAGWLSFFEWNMLPTTPLRYVGLANYRNIVALPKFWQAIGNTGLYVLGLLPLAVLIPLAIALYTEDLPAAARNTYRGIIFLPVIIAPVVAASVWRWLLDDGHGLVNVALRFVGLPQLGFLTDPRIALWTITVITGWKLIGFSTLILSAANARINPSLIEAALIDGATPWRTVRHIRLPLLSGTILFLTVLTLLLGAQWSFGFINVLTDGGPLGATTNIFYLLWDFGFSSLSVGWSAAAAVMLFLGFGLFAFVLFRLAEQFAFHDD